MFFLKQNQKHIKLWQKAGGEPLAGALGKVIHTQFGSLERLIDKINKEGAALQGSGWVVSFKFFTSSSYFFPSFIELTFALERWQLRLPWIQSQWLALDKENELKKLSIETTAKQLQFETQFRYLQKILKYWSLPCSCCMLIDVQLQHIQGALNMELFAGSTRDQRIQL